MLEATIVSASWYKCTNSETARPGKGLHAVSSTSSKWICDEENHFCKINFNSKSWRNISVILTINQRAGGNIKCFFLAWFVITLFSWKVNQLKCL
jgi:hypothetical protein